MKDDSLTGDVDYDNFDPHTPAFINNPYPSYKWFRENKPVLWVEKDYQSFWVFRHEDVKQILDRPDLWIKEEKSLVTKSLFASDGGRHTQLRDLLGPLFRESTQGLGPAVSSISDALIADGLISDDKADDSFNFISEYAHPLPSQTLAHVLGIKGESWLGIEQLVEKVIRANDPTHDKLVKGVGIGAMLAMRLGALASSFIEENDMLNMALQGLLEISDQIESGKMVSLMSDLAESSKGTEVDFTIRDVSANAVSLALAGYFTTTHVMGTGLVNLLNHPETLMALRESIKSNASAEIMSGVVNEMLRYDAPIHVLDRYAKETTQLGGVIINKGQKVAAVIGSANRDGDVFNEPDKFDFSRGSSDLLSFGHGVHSCLGAQMLRQVLPIALETFLTKFSSIEIAGETSWQTDPYFRGYTNLQLRTKKQ
jgi:cytochrome P450